MTSHLCMSVTLLDSLFHGKGDADQPQWPPSPMRLFQAILAGSRSGYYNRSWSDSKAKAFSWLEQQNAPMIIAPNAKPAPAYTLFVPNNDSDKKSDRQDRLTSKVARPHRLCSDAPIHYLWPIGDSRESSRSNAELLCHEARRITALGWGIDQAIGYGQIISDSEAATLPGERWRAWIGHRPGGKQWRIPKEGSLQDLEAVHVSFLQRVKGNKYYPALKVSCYDTVSYIPDTVLPPRSYAVFELPEGVAFRQQNSCSVAAMLRSRVCSKANRKDFREQFSNTDTEIYLAGHVKETKHTPPRFSYLPLPAIGHAHSDGMIRRLLITEPFGDKGIYAQWAQNRLQGSPLKDKDGNERGVLLNIWRQSSYSIIKRYTGEANAWSTITPVILPGYDDGKHIKAEKLFMNAIEQAGFSQNLVKEFSLRKAPFWPGSHHPTQYQVPAYLKHFPRWHVRIVFRTAIGGPIAVGAGRHCGLGLFAAAEALPNPQSDIQNPI